VRSGRGSGIAFFRSSPRPGDAQVDFPLPVLQYRHVQGTLPLDGIHTRHPGNVNRDVLRCRLRDRLPSLLEHLPA
jgi:hypothetical protein